MNPRRSSLLLHTALGFVLAAALAGCGGRGAATADSHGDPSIVLGASDVAVLRAADLFEGVPLSGTLTPSADARLTSPFKDVLTQVLVKEGQPVRKGQVLARFRADAVAPAASSAKAQLEAARSDLQRMTNLEKAGAVATRDLENARSSYEAAAANAAQANERLADATVRAPFDGVVAERHVTSGDRVGEGDLLFRIVNTRELEFEATVTAERAAQLKPGTPVSLTVVGVPAGAVAGRIARVNATADPATRQVRVYVVVANRDGRLVGDLFASGRVVLREARQTLAAPAPAVHAAATGGDELWVIEGARLATRPVTVGVRDESAGLVQVQGAVAAGDTVVVAATEGLKPGQTVQIAGRK